MTANEKASQIDFGSRVEIVDLIFIPMRDGRRLAARLFLPADRLERSIPAILEYIPYRCRDLSRPQDDEMHIWFAAHGYACARVDIAGTGDSDGLIQDEYTEREQRDALDVISWLASRDWSSGRVGMMGISWGGFNALQVAALRPPALKAIITVCSTVDRYADDVHFMGGCLLTDTLDWGGFFFTLGALPPDPGMVGLDRWKEIWAHRIAHLPCFPEIWMEHQRRDSYWKQGSVCEDFSRIDIPVLSVSGWADGYSNTVFKCIENLSNAQGIAGPWGHMYPHRGIPGPPIGFLQECKDWWDKWLKGVCNGVESRPALRAYLQDTAHPAPHHSHREGRWLAFQTWPSSNVIGSRLYLGEGTLMCKAQEAPQVSLCSPLSVGVAGGEWCAYALGGVTPELAFDQRRDDSFSLCFTGSTLAQPMAIVGRPTVHLRVAVDRQQAQIAVRLNAVHPDGSVERITYGLLNLNHHLGHESPSSLQLNQMMDVALELNDIAHLVPEGSRIRLAVSTSYWPMVWPSPQPVTLTIDPNNSFIDVPVLQESKDLPEVNFGAPEMARPASTTVLEPSKNSRTVNHNIGTGRVTFEVKRDDGWVRIDETGTEMRIAKDKIFSVSDDNSEPPCAEVTTIIELRRGEWKTRVNTRVHMTSDDEFFHLNADFHAHEDDKPFMSRTWRRSMRRDQL